MKTNPFKVLDEVYYLEDNKCKKGIVSCIDGDEVEIGDSGI